MTMMHTCDDARITMWMKMMRMENEAKIHNIDNVFKTMPCEMRDDEKINSHYAQRRI